MAKHPPRFKGTIRFDPATGRNRVEIGNVPRYNDYLRSLKPGKPVWITLETEENKRSLSQNALYWVYLNVIADETGDNANDLHEWAKRTFLPPKFITVRRRELRVPASTTTLSKAEFTEYLAKIEAETGVPIPDPEEAGYISN